MLLLEQRDGGVDIIFGSSSGSQGTCSMTGSAEHWAGWLVIVHTCSVQAAERKSPPRRVAGSRVPINTKEVIIARMIASVYSVRRTDPRYSAGFGLRFGF